MGSLTGVVASKSVTEASKGALTTIGKMCIIDRPNIIAISLLSESVTLKTNLSTAMFFSYHSCGKKETRVW